MRAILTAVAVAALAVLLSADAFAQQGRRGRAGRVIDRGLPIEARSPAATAPRGSYWSPPGQYPGRGGGGGGAPGP